MDCRGNVKASCIQLGNCANFVDAQAVRAIAGCTNCSTVVLRALLVSKYDVCQRKYLKELLHFRYIFLAHQSQRLTGELTVSKYM